MRMHYRLSTESDSGATETAAGAVLVRGRESNDLEVLTIGSDPIDKTSEETVAEKAAADAAEREKQLQMEKQQQMCPLVAECWQRRQQRQKRQQQ